MRLDMVQGWYGPVVRYVYGMAYLVKSVGMLSIAP